MHCFNVVTCWHPYMPKATSCVTHPSPQVDYHFGQQRGAFRQLPYVEAIRSADSFRQWECSLAGAISLLVGQPVRVAAQGKTPQRGSVETSSAQFATLVHKAKLKVAKVK